MTTTTNAPVLETEAEKRAYAREAAQEIVGNARRSNAEYEARTGRPSSISEADYQKAEQEVEASLLRIAGLKPLRSR